MTKLTKDTIGVGFLGAGDISVLHAAAVKKCLGENALREDHSTSKNDS